MPLRVKLQSCATPPDLPPSHLSASLPAANFSLVGSSTRRGFPARVRGSNDRQWPQAFDVQPTSIDCTGFRDDTTAGTVPPSGEVFARGARRGGRQYITGLDEPAAPCDGPPLGVADEGIDSNEKGSCRDRIYRIRERRFCSDGGCRSRLSRDPSRGPALRQSAASSAENCAEAESRAATGAFATSARMREAIPQL